MEIKLLPKGYVKHSCNIQPNRAGEVAVIEYRHEVTNHEFMGAYRAGGLFDAMDEAKALMLKHYPNATVELAVPDLVFRVPKR